MAETSSSLNPEPEKNRENPKKITFIGPNPEKYKSKSKGKSILTYDFDFVLLPTSTFVYSITSLVNYIFNPSKMGLLEVDRYGFSITAYNVTQSKFGGEDENVFGLLRLQTGFFERFDCENPVTKMINLEHFLLSLYNENDHCFLNVYSVTGSNQLTFEFDQTSLLNAGKVIEASRPSVIQLLDVSPEYLRFPDIICGTETSIPSSYLTPLISEILEKAPEDTPDFVNVLIRKPSVSLTVGEKTIRVPPEKLNLWLNWPFWQTLQTAKNISGECFIYVVLEPEESLMILFKITDPDDPISFKRGTFTRYESLSCLAFLRSLADSTST